jgi:hypothetical protein
MEIVFRISLFIAGIINFLPSLLAFFPEKISKSYGIEAPNASNELILRHRAILFGIIGLLMLYSSIMKKYYGLSSSFGLISMISFIVLYFIIGKEISAELKKVMFIDLVGTIILLLGILLYWPSSNF